MRADRRRRTTTTSPCSRSGTAAAATRTCASSRGSRARTRSCAGRTSRASSASSPSRRRSARASSRRSPRRRAPTPCACSTIHAAKGLEFKVVIVADAGRDTAPPSPDEILALSDGRFGFRVADPVTTKRRGAFDYDGGEGGAPGGGARRAAAPLLRRDDAGEGAADRLRLGRPRREARDADADRLGARPPRRGRGARRGGRRARRARARATRGCSCALDRFHEAGRAAGGARTTSPSPRQASSRSSPRSRRSPRRGRGPGAAAARGAAGAAAPPRAPALVHGALDSSSSARTSTTRSTCSGMSERPSIAATATAGCVATEIGDAVHRLLEQVDLHAPHPDLEQVRVVPTVRDEELERIRGFVAVVLRLRARAPRRGLRRASTRSGTSRSSTTACSCTASSTRFQLLDGPRALVVDYKTNAARRVVAGGDRRGGLPAAAARLRARVLPRGRRGGRGRLPLPRAAGRRRLDDVHAADGRGARGRALRRRSRASTPASSGRRRATSRAPAARRSTSSAPGPRLRRGGSPEASCLVASCRRPGSASGRRSSGSARSSSGSRSSTPTPRSRSASAARSSCSSR